MVTQYAFFVDSDACSGCKTCQVACKDYNNLPAGVLWRRVYEVTAGGWSKQGEAWTQTVVAYNLSVSCHHCLEPACAEACSPQAIWKREDGIVLFDETRCTRCMSCKAACSYGAFRSDPLTVVSKCHGCVDELAQGRPPICVSACPNRALEFGEFAELKKKYGEVSRVFPLPDPAGFKPALVIRPHRSLASPGMQGAEISNWEELA
jgi:anaerobic dimethyl sulfoxide reductase subunit B (iron-sulfur subunit)